MSSASLSKSNDSTDYHSINTGRGHGRNNRDARDAYRRGDREGSRRAHHNKTNESDHDGGDNHGDNNERSSVIGDYLKSIVYGGLDGIITTFSTVTSVSGARLDPVVIVVLGISHLFSDGLSMATGDAMSSQAEIDYHLEERRREEWELRNDKNGEIAEMIQILEKKGVSSGDAQTVITTLSKYDDAFLDLMLNEELGIPKSEENAPAPYKSGLVTMLSFILFGSIPLLPYLISLIPMFRMSDDVQLYSAITATVLTLFILGCVKAQVAAGTGSWWYNGLLMALNGSFAAVIGFIVGYAMGKLVGVQDQDLPPGSA